MTTPPVDRAESAGAGADPRRLVPRTDVVLTDPRLQAAARNLGAAVVKRAVVDAQSLARAGKISPSAVGFTPRGPRSKSLTFKASRSPAGP